MLNGEFIECMAHDLEHIISMNSPSAETSILPHTLSVGFCPLRNNEGQKPLSATGFRQRENRPAFRHRAVKPASSFSSQSCTVSFLLR